MGRNRNGDQNQSTTEVSNINRVDFGIKDTALYALWQQYYNVRILGNGSPVEAANAVMVSGVSFKLLCYFIAVGMEALTEEYLKEGACGCGQSMGLLN